jgi:cytochrome c biogenesis protein CcdA
MPPARTVDARRGKGDGTMAATLAYAFLAGLASFVSPCVLPLVPVYLAQLAGPGIWRARSGGSAPGGTPASTPVDRAGTSRVAGDGGAGMAALQALSSQAMATQSVSAQSVSAQSVSAQSVSVRAVAARAVVLLHACAFVAGFGLVFVVLGASASALGALLTAHQELLRRVAGVALVVFGLHVAGVLRIPGLERERRFHPRVGAPGYASSFGVGVAFGFGWAPCVGPYLASLLVLAAQARTLHSAVLLLGVYALGLGLPFLIVGAAFDRMVPLLRRLSP